MGDAAFQLWHTQWRAVHRERGWLQLPPCDPECQFAQWAHQHPKYSSCPSSTCTMSPELPSWAAEDLARALAFQWLQSPGVSSAAIRSPCPWIQQQEKKERAIPEPKGQVLGRRKRKGKKQWCSSPGCWRCMEGGDPARCHLNQLVSSELTAHEELQQKATQLHSTPTWIWPWGGSDPQKGTQKEQLPFWVRSYLLSAP